MIHAFQLRAEITHGLAHRQLRALATAILAVALFPLSLQAAPEPKSSAREELVAAQLMTAALFARDAKPEELRKMEGIFADLVTKYPRDATIKNGQAEFLWSMDEHARAVDAWLAAEKLDSQNAVVLDHLGGSFMAAGNAKKAGAYYGRATAAAPENATFHYNYANVAFLFRHELTDATYPDSNAVLRHALSHFADAARLDPLNAEYARAYAETFYTIPNADWQEALRAWQHFYEIAASKDFALVNLARIQLNLGNKAEAREHLSRVQSREFDRSKARLLERIEAAK